MRLQWYGTSLSSVYFSDEPPKDWLSGLNWALNLVRSGPRSEHSFVWKSTKVGGRQFSGGRKFRRVDSGFYSISSIFGRSDTGEV